jgi:hypothetical protein
VEDFLKKWKRKNGCFVFNLLMGINISLAKNMLNNVGENMNESLLNNRKIISHEKITGGKKMKVKFAFSMAILMLMLGILATSNSFAAITFSQLSNYDETIHYNTLAVYPDDYDAPLPAGGLSDPVTLGAVARGKAEVPILKVQVVGETGAETFFEGLTLVYSGTRLPDIGSYVSIYETTYTTAGKLVTATLINERSISGGEATLLVGHTVGAGAVKTYVIALDIASSAGSNKIDLRVKLINGTTTVGSTTGYVEDGGNVTVGNIGIVHTPNPVGYTQVDAGAPAITTVTYNTGTKILTLQFSDAGARDAAGNPINVTNPRVNVIDRDGDTTLFRVDLSKIQIRALDDAPARNLSGASLRYPDDETEIPATLGVESRADTNVVKIKLTPAQDAFVQNDILKAGEVGGAEVYINGALYDYNFGNLLGENIPALSIIADTTPPVFVEPVDKPVKLDSKTRLLTLTFKESMNAVPRTEVKLDKINIFNWIFDEDGVPIIDTGSKINLVGATVAEGYGTTVTITLTPSQRDVLLGDRPQLELTAGAVKDMTGNVNAAATANVLVTPALLSGVETVYDGNLTGIVLDFKFTEAISTVDATKITITNERDEDFFSLSTSEFDTIKQENSIARIASFNLTKAHRDKISYWQRNANINELRVKLDAKAVVDIYGASNEAMAQAERIRWIEDTSGPIMTYVSTYTQSTRLLNLRFSETLDLTPEGEETIANLVDSSKITLSNPLALGDNFPLTNDELIPNQSDDWWLQYTLTIEHNDVISRWQNAGATQINISVVSGAVKDISNRNLAPDSTGNISSANWIRDTVRPTFVAAYYSVPLKSLVIRFSESITQPNLSLIKVHAAGATPVVLGDAKVAETPGDTLKIINLGTDAQTAIANVGNPQVDLLATSTDAAVRDLSGNLISQILNRPITYDEGGPTLNTTGNTYEHIWDETTTPPNQGLLKLNFKEIVDVSTITDLAKIKLEAGTTSIPLSGAEVLTKEDAQIVEIKIKDEDTVGKVAGLQLEFTTLYVRLEAGAVQDLAGNGNVEVYQALEKWVGDTKKPELDYTNSYYIHDLTERGKHYARLVLKFNELMDTRPAYLNFSGIVVANPGGTPITLTSGELKPDQGLSDEIQFNLTDDHRDTISDWGKVGYGGSGYKELHIYLAEGSVKDRAGNSVLVKPVQKFAEAKANVDTTPEDDRFYPYSKWEKDLRPAEYVSSTYDANTKVMTITFDEWMDQAPPDATTVNPSKITVKDKNEGNAVVLAAAGWTEQAKTKTVIFTLTAEKDASVKALANDIVGQNTETIYLYLDAGAAVDYSGVGSAAVSKKTITYTSTRDTTKPTLSVSDDAAGSTYDHKYGVDLADSDELGVLTLYFSEAVDKNYDAIDATKIRLSNTASGGGFALTQAEILKAAGNRVYPLASSLVNQIQFDLNATHWDVIAKEKWGAIYIQVEVGAVKDTSGNTIAAVSAAMPDSHYHRDITQPDVRLPDAPISSAPVGGNLNITATVTDDIQTQEVRLYYQVGGAVRTYVNMTASGSTYTGTIPGTTVTNKGLCYYVWAVDQAGNENITGNGNIKTRKGNLDEWHYTSIPGGFPVTVTGVSAQLPANTLPVFDAAAVPSTYRMLAVPITASPSTTTLFAPLGTAGVDWMAWKYTGGSENNGYQAGHITPFSFEPARGVAAWVGTVNPDKVLTVTGNTSQLSNFYHQSDVAGKRYLYEITLHAGWNQVGIPFNFSRNWDRSTISSTKTGGIDDISDRIYWFTGGKSAYSFASLDATVPNQDVFATSWNGSGIPDNALVWNGWPGSLDPWGGYWIYSNREGAKMYIDPTTPGKGVLPVTPTAPSVEMPYNWSVKVMPEAGGVFGTAKFAGIVSDATDGIDRYDVMDLPALPGQIARLSFITETGDYLQDMKAPADEMFWNFKVNSAVNTPVTLRFDASAVPSEYRTVMLIDIVTDATTDLRKVASYAYKPSDALRNFKLIISKAHPETYIVPKHSVLLQNYPNPFNPETWVPYRLSTAGDVTINIYNVAGQLVRTLELGHREAGSYTVKERTAYWDGRNVTGERVASGVYFYNIQSGSFHAIKRMVIVK